MAASFKLKDKSGLGIIVDYSIVVNGVQYFFQFFSLLICETTYVFQSAKKCIMTSFSILNFFYYFILNQIGYILK